MPTNWRALLDDVGIEWTDRGSNARRGCVNVQCPFCGAADPSQHMLISENNSGYHCHRAPQRHKGKDYMRLLQALLPAHSRVEIAELLNRHATPFVESYARPRLEPSDIEKQWAKFLPAADNARCLDYLYDRGFPDPAALCRRHDLRYARYGRWSGRVLMPVTNADGRVMSWSGRAMLANLEPRYDMPPAPTHELFYVPRAPRAICVVVEGPIDALKIVTGAESLPVWSLAMLGLSMDDNKLLALIERTRPASELWLVFDQGSDVTVVYRLKAMLAKFRPNLYISPLRAPIGFKDAGEMPVSAVFDWLAPLTRGESPWNTAAIFPSPKRVAS